MARSTLSTTPLEVNLLHETEADRMGVELAARAGYDPRAAVSLWQKMAKLSGGAAPPALLSTHPSNEERIKDLGTFSQRVLPTLRAGGNEEVAPARYGRAGESGARAPGSMVTPWMIPV